MVQHLETSPTAPPAAISSYNSFSSFGRTLAISALVTIFTMVITALVKYVVIRVIHWWNQLFRKSAAASVALGHVASEAPEPTTQMAPAAQTGPELIAPVAPGHVAPAAPEVVGVAAGQGVVGIKEIVQELR